MACPVKGILFLILHRRKYWFVSHRANFTFLCIYTWSFFIWCISSSGSFDARSNPGSYISPRSNFCLFRQLKFNGSECSYYVTRFLPLELAIISTSLCQGSFLSSQHPEQAPSLERKELFEFSSQTCSEPTRKTRNPSQALWGTSLSFTISHKWPKQPIADIGATTSTKLADSISLHICGNYSTHAQRRATSLL